MNDQTASLLAVRDVTKRFGESHRRTVAVKHATCRVNRGELVVVLGPSGSGKTTLLQIAAGLIPPSTGSVQIMGHDLSQYSATDLQRLRARRLGFVFQTCRLLDPLSAIDNVALAAKFAGRGREDSIRIARRILGQLGVGHLVAAYPPELSQGERQRVAVARAIVNAPDLLFADEPTASLESSQGIRLIEILAEYVRVHQAGLMVATHDLRLTAFADRILRIDDGELMEQGRFCTA